MKCKRFDAKVENEDFTDTDYWPSLNFATRMKPTTKDFLTSYNLKDLHSGKTMDPLVSAGDRITILR